MINENVMNIFPLLYSLLAAAMLGIARWLLGAHATGQILLGYTVGILALVVAFCYLNT
jgi:phosphate starvation-inducible membrane PsiE